ncbi:MAG: ECF transporter S component [Anaerolineales bacterium]|nr:ECF transporter S component [Anaerolineales bacterium]
MNDKSTWEFGTRQVVYGAIGAALYGVLSWASNFVPLPAAGNVTFRPAVAVLIFFGTAYGPWVGFLAGFIGNTLGDAISGWGFLLELEHWQRFDGFGCRFGLCPDQGLPRSG